MYLGTWIWRRNKIPCTRVHESEKPNLGTFWKKGVGGGLEPKKISVLFRFLSTLKNNLIFWKKIKIMVAPWLFESKIFITGFTFAVALIQNEKIKVERVSILMGHPVYLPFEVSVKLVYKWKFRRKVRIYDLTKFEHNYFLEMAIFLLNNKICISVRDSSNKYIKTDFLNISSIHYLPNRLRCRFTWCLE